MLTIRKAVEGDVPAICELYDHIIDLYQWQVNKPGWKKGVYPIEADFRAALERDAMYVGELDGRLAAGMVVRQGMDEGYRGGAWLVDVEDSQVAVIHTLGVHPELARGGLGLEMVRGAIQAAREKGCKTVRLDDLDGNPAAERLYQKAGFSYAGDMQIFYEDTGLADFHLYEYVL